MSETETKVEPNSSSVESESERRQRTQSEGNDSNPDIHFEPIVDLPLIDIKTLEENETELLKLRAKLYRYDTSEDVAQFKERGTGEVKLLKHKNIRAVRIVMRRDKTLKLCANHYIMPAMELKRHSNSDKVFVWSTFADLSDETPKRETLAIRFGNVENAQKFKDLFEESKRLVSDPEDIANNFSKINIKNDEKNSESEETDSENESDNEVDKEVDKEVTEEENKDKNETKSGTEETIKATNDV